MDDIFLVLAHPMLPSRWGSDIPPVDECGAMEMEGDQGGHSFPVGRKGGKVAAWGRESNAPAGGGGGEMREGMGGGDSPSVGWGSRKGSGKRRW